MGQNTVFHLVCQQFRKSRDFLNLLVDHLHADDDMADELSLLRIVVARELGKFSRLSDIVKKSYRDQQISLEIGIISAEKMAQVGDAERVLRKASHKAVVNALCRRGLSETVNKFLILYEKQLEQLNRFLNEIQGTARIICDAIDNELTILAEEITEEYNESNVLAM